MDKLNEKDSKNNILDKINRKHCLLPFLRAMISRKDTFERLRREFILIRCEVIFKHVEPKTCGEKPYRGEWGRSTK